VSNYAYNPITGQLDLVGSGGASYINGVVATPADLPVTVGTPALDSVYLAKAASGVWLINRRPAGLYCRVANNGNLTDWYAMSAFPEVNADGNWSLYNTSDPTKELGFSLASIGTGTKRIITAPNKNITLDDAGDSRTPTSHTHTGSQINVGTTANLPLKTGTNGVVEAGSFGTAAGSFCEGSDARLSDDRDPNLHAASHLPDGADELFDQSLNTDDAPAFRSLSVLNANQNGITFYAYEEDGETKIDIGFSDGPTKTFDANNYLVTEGDLGTAAAEDTTAFAASGSITTSGLTQATARILGRTTASTGSIEEIQIGSGLSLSAGELSATGSGVTAVGASTADVLSVSGSDLVADDPNADRIIFWDDSESKLRYLEAGSGLSISGTTMTATGGIGGGTGSTDNSILRSDGTGGSTLQASGINIDDAIVSYSITGAESTDIITATGHNFTANQGVRFTALTGGAGLSTATNYFVRDISGSTFKVSTTSGGAAFNFTTDISAGTIVATEANVTLANVDAETNSSLVLTPKGTGAFIVGPKPDGTATGGQRRGTNAICMVRNRNNVNQVASGASSIAIGEQARANGTSSVSIGIFASDSSGNGSTCIGPDTTSTTDALAIGRYAVASGIQSMSFCQGTASGVLSVQFGSVSNASLRSQFLTRPFSSVYWGGQTTNATPTVLNLDATATNRFTIAANTALAVDILLVARRSDTADKWLVARRFLGIRRDGSNNTSLIGTVQDYGLDQSAGSPSWTFALTADDTNEALQLEVTGAASETIQWRATAFYRVA
jgi:hypothetical protein